MTIETSSIPGIKDYSMNFLKISMCSFKRKEKSQNTFITAGPQHYIFLNGK